ncbi:hypothetical protein D9M69_646440 [compost metagenome]
MQRDLPGTPCDLDSVWHAIDPLDQNDDVRCLRRSGRPARAHGDPDVGRSQGRRIIDTVTHHHRRLAKLFGRNGCKLFSRTSIGIDFIDAKGRCDGAGSSGVVAGNHDDARDAGCMKLSQCDRRLRSDCVRQ